MRCETSVTNFLAASKRADWWWGVTVCVRVCVWEGGVLSKRKRKKQFSLFYSEKGRNAASNYFGWDMKVKQGGG